jgi:hypothetical protein
MQKAIHGRWSSFVRLVYNPRSQLSEGYFVNNLLHCFDNIRSIDGSLHKYFGMSETYDNPRYFKYKGLALADLEKEAKKIYRFLLYDVGLRVSKLTVDFMRDDNKIWFLNLKSYELEPNSYKIKGVYSSMNEKEIVEERRARKEKAENTGKGIE